MVYGCEERKVVMSFHG